jgi:hypothetical protein
MHLPFESGIGTGGAPLTAHLLQVTADRLHRMAIHAHFDGIHTTRRADAWSPSAPGSAALPFPPGCAPHQQRGWRRYRPTAAPRRADQTHPPVPPRAGGVGGWSGRATPRVAPERARARHPVSRRDAHAIRRTAPVWWRIPHRRRARARSDSAGRAPGGTSAGKGCR